MKVWKQGDIVGTSTSKYIKKKKLTEKQKKRNEHAMQKLDEIDLERKNKTSWKIHNSFFNALDFSMHLAQTKELPFFLFADLHADFFAISHFVR